MAERWLAEVAGARFLFWIERSSDDSAWVASLGEQTRQFSEDIGPLGTLTRTVGWHDEFRCRSLDVTKEACKITIKYVFPEYAQRLADVCWEDWSLKADEDWHERIRPFRISVPFQFTPRFSA